MVVVADGLQGRQRVSVEVEIRTGWVAGGVWLSWEMREKKSGLMGFFYYFNFLFFN